MTTVEKLVKSLETLKLLQLSPALSEETALRKKEKISHCQAIADAMCHSGVKGAPNFSHLLSIAIEILLQLCDDPVSDVRMMADESLNRVIRAMTDTNVVKIQVELHKEIKKNGNPRTLRAALWRFAELCHLIRPQKGKPYATNLIPCIIHIARRKEENVLETLATYLPKIFKALGNFTTDNDVKGLLKAFLQNLSSSSAVVRRTAAASILTVCLHCRKPHVFFSYILNTLLDSVIPVQEGQSVSTVLGVLSCLRNIIPHISMGEVGAEEMRGSFGVRRCLQENMPSAVDRIIQVYELCLYYTNHPDHNVVNTALETLHQLLQSPPPDFVPLLTSPHGVTRSRIHAADGQEKLTQRSLSQMSVAQSLALGDESSLLDPDPDLPDLKYPVIENWVDEAKAAFSSSKSGSSEKSYADERQSPEMSSVENANEDADEFDMNSLIEENVCEYSNIRIGKIQDDGRYPSPIRTTPKSPSMAPQLSTQSEEDASYVHHSPTSVASQTRNVPFLHCDTGCFTDADVPLLYCARHLAASFLLTGCVGYTIPEPTVRVSVKNLALSCIACVVHLYPKIIFMSLDKNKDPASPDVQTLSDVLLFENHLDPYLRGIASSVSGNLLESALIQSGGDFEAWATAELPSTQITVNRLLTMLVKGMSDSEYVCARQALQSLSSCLPELLESMESHLALPVLKALLLVANNKYWLLKAKLVEVLSQLSYITIHHLQGSSEFQDKIIHSVILTLLRDEDVRVRHAAATAIVNIVPKLLFTLDRPQQDAATAKAAYYSEKFLLEIVVTTTHANNNSINSLPEPFNVCSSQAVRCHHLDVDTSLSRIINLLSRTLLMSDSKYLTWGCCEALAMLSQEHLTTVYPRAWSLCFKQTTSAPPGNAIESPAAGLLTTVLSILTASPVSLDLSCQQWLIQLSGNLFSGFAVYNLSCSDYTSDAADSHKQLWGVMKDKQFASCAELLLQHVVRILNIFVHILDEVNPTVQTLKPSLPSLPTAPSLSPMKRKGKAADGTTSSGKITEGSRTRGMSPVKSASEKEDKSSEEKRSGRGTAMGLFAGISHYMRIYEIVKSAYTNYRISLESSASEKFVSLLHTTLETLSQILEVATLTEAGRIAEEILSYLRSTVTVEPTSTVKCVQQLLKSLFGTNISAQWEERDEYQQSSFSSRCMSTDGFYNVCFQTPYQQLTDFINSTSPYKMPDKEGLMWSNNLRRKKERKMSAFKGFGRGADKTSLASYIRLFEPMVIKALKQYTVTSDVKLQCRVLLLLSQLVQLRVNYCLLDSDQIFIGFVLKQFEFIEEGQIVPAEELIPRIFYFLVHLSYEKHHSKCIIGIPKVIQLCDGLMASGQSPVTHCIPALVPIVEDVFLVRGTSSTSSFDMKELDTQREVLLSMLLRLVEYHQVLDLLSVVLNECRDSEERWRRWSRQVVDTLFPLLSQGRVRLESRAAQHSLQQVLSSVSPGVLRPVDSLLRVLFSHPPQLGASTVAMERWLGMVLAVLLVIISQGKEEVVLARLEELELSQPSSGSAETRDPLNVAALPKFVQLPPEQVMARFLVRVCDLVSSHIHASVHSALMKEESEYLQEQFAHFLLYCIYMFQSGNYCRIATCVMDMSRKQTDSAVQIHKINASMLEMAPKCPMLTFQWCYLLTLINFSDQEFWAKVLHTKPHDFLLEQGKVEVTSYQPSPCINLEVVRKGATILYSDFMSENMNEAEQLTWFLVNHIEEIVALSTEAPVQELIAAVHRNPVASGLLVQAVAARCHRFKQPSFVCRVLRCLEGVHPSQSGALLMLIIPRLLRYPQLAPARLAGTLACRRAELLVTLPPAEVASQLAEADLRQLMEVLHTTSLARKHNGLMSLMNKLAVQCYKMAPLELGSGTVFNPSDVRSITVDKSWFLKQVSARCSLSGPETAQLLSKLEYEDVVSVLSSKEFNSLNLMDCLKLGTQLSLQALQSDAGDGLESALYRASRLSLLQHVTNIRALMPKHHQVFNPHGREMSTKEGKYCALVEQLFLDSELWRVIFNIAPALTCYLQSIPLLAKQVPQESWEDIARFGILCLEAVQWLQSDKCRVPQKPWHLHVALRCADEILQEPNLVAVMSHTSHASWTASAASALTCIVTYLLEGELPTRKDSGLEGVMGSPDTMCAAHSCLQMALLVDWLEKTRPKSTNIPVFFMKHIKSLIVSVSRLPMVNSYVATPPEAWKQGFTAEWGGPFHTQVQPLPIQFLQEIDILRQLIFRITLLGWTSRRQFEETWMALIGVLNNPIENQSLEDAAIVIHATGLTVQAITALLIQTLMKPMPGNPNASQLVHQPREKPLPQTRTNEKLRAIHDLLCWKLVDGQNKELQQVFKRSNIERILNPHRYGYSQVSLEYLWTATQSEGEVPHSAASGVCLEHKQRLIASGLDLHSCLHFLLDQYSQWTLPQSGTPLQLTSEAVRSILVISDLFTEKAQFQWMLSTFLELGKHHPVEDEILHQYLVLGACKAAAVLGPDSEVYERVRKMIENSLRSVYLPARIAGLHGVLYLLQATKTDEIFHFQPIAIEYVQKHIDISSGPGSRSEEHQLVMWGLVFYLLENMEEKMVDIEVAPAVLQLALSLVTAHNLSPGVQLALVQGLERLVVMGSVGGKVAEQVTKLAVERMRHPNPAVAIPALQLLLSCMYTEREDDLRSHEDKLNGKDNYPELLIQAMERTSALFERIKKGYPFEVALVCGVLPSLLTDFFPPSEIMTKVIGEFLSTQQPHPQLLAAVVFQIFERACQQAQLPLLQDWVVLSAANFTQCSPVGMASWCLTCFFISASTNQWLRALFPHVQSRIGRCESEDRKLLCIAAADFYSQLRDNQQKQSFQTAFQTASSQPLFSDLIACL